MQSKGSSGTFILLLILGTTLISGCLDAEEVDVDVFPEEGEDDIEQTNENEPDLNELDEESFIQRVVEALADADEDYLNMNIQSSMIEMNEEMMDRLYAVFANADVSSINVYEQQDELEDNEVEYEVVVRAGFTDPAYEELYGEDVQLTLDLQLYREQNDWQVSHLFMHTPIPTDHSTDDEVKFITPEQFAQEYYSEVTNENWEVIPSYIADEWQQQEALTDQELAERYAMRVPRVEDAQVLMGDVFHEQIQQAIPDLPAMKADETSYIVRAEYKLEGEERFLAEDLLLVQQDERFRIVEFHQYDAFESIN